jgi:nucleotide-binding universal stress UspA family protein
MFKHALVTTDGSPFARAILQYVPSVVGPDGRVTVIEVIDDPARLLAKTNAGFEFSLVSTMGLDIAEEVIAGERLAAETHLKAALRCLNDAGIADVETLILQGTPGDVIVAEAKRQQADILLMATHGRTGLKRAVMGSVTNYVLHHLEDIPILLIHPQDESGD